MIKISEVQVLPEYHLYLKFTDATEGELDVSEFLDKGVFKIWRDVNFFQSVRVSKTRRSLKWGREIDLGADTLYMRLTGMNPEQMFSLFAAENLHA